MSVTLFVDLLGWVGALSVLLAYGLISNHKLRGDSPTYQLLNFTGGALLLLNTVYYGALPSAFVNVVWIVIAIWAMFNILRARKGHA